MTVVLLEHCGCDVASSPCRGGRRHTIQDCARGTFSPGGEVCVVSRPEMEGRGLCLAGLHPFLLAGFLSTWPSASRVHHRGGGS